MTLMKILARLLPMDTLFHLNRKGCLMQHAFLADNIVPWCFLGKHLFFFFPLHLHSNSEWELYAEGSARFPVCLANIHGVLLRAQLSHPLSTQKCTLRGRRKTRLEKAPESTGHQLLATLLAQSSTGAKTSPALPSQLSFQRWHFSTLSQLAPTCMENKSSALPPAAHKPNPTFPKHAWC